MKKLLPIFLLLFPSLISAQSNEIEKFHSFLVSFSSDSLFQLSRIQFPVTSVTLDQEYFEEVESKIQKADWTYIDLIGDELFKLDVRTQTYDNFDLKLEDSGERVFSLISLYGGMHIYYYFKRVNGKWFLVKLRDIST
tara:strand:+ start:64 stop:477 length:414 start_codon:yes stop_codon:yes gene_type:complete